MLATVQVYSNFIQTIEKLKLDESDYCSIHDVLRLMQYKKDKKKTGYRNIQSFNF